MSKYLDLSGLEQYTKGVKDYISGLNHVVKGEDITVGNATIKDAEIAVYNDAHTVGAAIGVDEKSQTPSMVVMDAAKQTVTAVESDKITLTGEGGVENITIDNTKVKAPAFVKTGSDANHVLLGDGTDLAMNVANGIARLGANGKLAASLVDIDTTLFTVVTSLPTTGIIKNRIYLVKSSSAGSQNTYAEYIYTGDVAATYDASKWEKLGEYKSDVDLSGYVKKADAVASIQAVTSNATAATGHYTKADGSTATYAVPTATQSAAGVMQASDKKALDTLTARYPLSISGISATPSLVEVGVAADVTFAWTISNEDFHPVTAQSISVAGGTAQNVVVGTKSYKQTALAGATTATTKSATVTIKSGSTVLTKDVTITYHYPSYIGVMANGATVNETSVKALTKSIEWGKGKKATLTQSNQIIVYAYPKSYGDLTSIKDGNGFEGFAGYTKQAMTIGGQDYNVYVQNIAATSNSTYTFA